MWIVVGRTQAALLFYRCWTLQRVLLFVSIVLPFVCDKTCYLAHSSLPSNEFVIRWNSSSVCYPVRLWLELVKRVCFNEAATWSCAFSVGIDVHAVSVYACASASFLCNNEPVSSTHLTVMKHLTCTFHITSECCCLYVNVMPAWYCVIVGAGMYSYIPASLNRLLSTK